MLKIQLKSWTKLVGQVNGNPKTKVLAESIGQQSGLELISNTSIFRSLFKHVPGLICSYRSQFDIRKRYVCNQGVGRPSDSTP
jgi:hypothetical protein